MLALPFQITPALSVNCVYSTLHPLVLYSKKDSRLSIIVLLEEEFSSLCSTFAVSLSEMPNSNKESSLQMSEVLEHNIDTFYILFTTRCSLHLLCTMKMMFKLPARWYRLRIPNTHILDLKLSADMMLKNFRFCSTWIWRLEILILMLNQCNLRKNSKI